GFYVYALPPYFVPIIIFSIDCHRVFASLLLTWAVDGFDTTFTTRVSENNLTRIPVHSEKRLLVVNVLVAITGMNKYVLAIYFVEVTPFARHTNIVVVSHCSN